MENKKIQKKLKKIKVYACTVVAQVTGFPQQTSRASKCMRNSGGIFLPFFQAGKEGCHEV